MDMPHLQKTQILLEPAQRIALREIAEREKTSVSKLVRSLVDEGLKKLSEREAEARTRTRKALERIRERSEKLVAEGVWIEDPTEALRRSREERGKEIDGWRGSESL